LPGTRLPAAQGRDHRLAVLTALALFEPRGDAALMRAKGRA